MRVRFQLVASIASFASILGIGSAIRAAGAAGFELKKGDRICIIGNTLAERMQHTGHFEALLQSRFPHHELVVRNLGFSGDELTTRLRSENFGSPEKHLTKHKASVVFAFFGYNESFGGEKGLEKFKKDLDKLIEETLGKKYDGEAAPRLAVFSPIGYERLPDPNLPDGKEINGRLKLYTRAMADVAKARGVRFVDLLGPSLELYSKAKEPLTFNGIHLREIGDRLMAPVMDRGLFAGDAPAIDATRLEKVRAAVLDKNFHWFNRYRTVDGYSIFGGRAGLKFVDGQTNRDVMDREMEILDAMTANRDKVIWAAVRGEDLKPDDSNTPAFIPVKTNKPGSGPNGEHVFIGGEEAIAKMKVHKGMKVNLFASEERFPDIAKAVQMAFDAKGRLWLTCMPSYPHWKPKDFMNDKVVILEDHDGDGKADKSTVFAGGLHVPTGIEFWGGGVFVGGQPDLLFLKDIDGDDRADVRERRVHGIDSADTHHALNSFALDGGGALYFQEGTFHHTQVETPYGPPVRSANAAVYRYEPRAQKFEVYVAYGFANPHGHVFDRWGQDIVTDGTGNENYFAAAFSGHTDFPRKHRDLRRIFKQRNRPCGGTEFLSSRHFPPELQGNFLNCNVIGFLGIFQYRITDDGAGYKGEEVEPIVESSDSNFRPIDAEIGPDGAIYFIDWQNPIIGHMQHNLRDPSRDQKHGRVYRVTYEGRPLLEPARIAGEPTEKLLDLLKEPEDRVRSRAKIELSGRKSEEMLAALESWVAKLDPADPEHQHHLLEALWVAQHHNVVNEPLLKRLLRSPDPRARAAATRVLCYWRDRVAAPLELLAVQVKDEHPRVRLEAVRALSFFKEGKAAEIALESAELPQDYYLKYTLDETLRTLEKYTK